MSHLSLVLINKSRSILKPKNVTIFFHNFPSEKTKWEATGRSWKYGGWDFCFHFLPTFFLWFSPNTWSSCYWTLTLTENLYFLLSFSVMMVKENIFWNKKKERLVAPKILGGWDLGFGILILLFGPFPTRRISYTISNSCFLLRYCKNG